MQRLLTLWSLKDMLMLAAQLESQLSHLRMMNATYQARQSRDEELSDVEKQMLNFAFVMWRHLFQMYGLDNCVTVTDHLFGAIPDGQVLNPQVLNGWFKKRMTVGMAQDRLKQLLENYEKDSRPRTIFWLDKDRAKYYGKTFGSDVDKAFPSALQEIEEAHRCYALERYTASVFHLMRGVEHVLRATCTAVGVTTPTVPLEYQMWENLIEQIQAETIGPNGAVKAWPKENKANARAFFSRIIADFHAFKDDVRNVMMHTRTGGTYTGPGALSVMNKVEECFKRVATRIDENTSSSALLDPHKFDKP